MCVLYKAKVNKVKRIKETEKVIINPEVQTEP